MIKNEMKDMMTEWVNWTTHSLLTLWTNSSNRGISRGDGPLVAQMTEVIVEGELSGEESW